MQEINQTHIESVTGGVLGFIVVWLINKTGSGMADTTGNSSLDAVVGGNLGS